MTDLIKKAQAQLNSPPKKPGKGVMPRQSLIDGDGNVHWIWVDAWTAHCLEDMATKLNEYERAEAERDGSMN